MSGQTGGLGSQRSRASSTCTRTHRRKSASDSVTASGPIGTLAGDRRRPSKRLRAVRIGVEGRRLELAALVQHLDAALGLLEPGMTESGQLDAALVQRERLLERHVAFLELSIHALQLRDCCLEVFN